MARNKDFDKNEVLQKAVRLFWDKGYNGTSMQDLVEGLGISRSSLYDTFGDKHKLYLLALESYKDAYGTELCALTWKGASARIAVYQILALVTDNLLNDQQRRGCFMVNAGVELASHDTEVYKLVCSTENQLEQAFFKVIKLGQENGEISEEKDPLAIARFLNNIVKGLQVTVKSTSDRKLFDDIIKVALMVLD